MVSTSVTPAVEVGKSDRRGVRLAIAGLLLLLLTAAVCVAILLARHFWPFEPKPILQNLQGASDSQVRIRGFHHTYFPYPGCILDGVVFLHGTNAAKPLIKIERLTIRTTYLGMLAHSISLIHAEGLEISVPAFGSGQSFHARRSTIAIREIITDGATLEFALRNPDTSPLRFDIHEASLRDVGTSGSLSYRVKVHNPEPPGEIIATGNFGTWDDSDPGETPVSGEYKFDKADLGVYGGVAGTLSSAGKFGGKLGHIDISGTTDTPNFEVTSGGNPVPLTTEFSAYVDGTNGDTFLKRVEAQFRKTHVVAEGSIAKSAEGEGKTTLINVSISNGRIEDILRLFAARDRSPMSGAVTLRTKVEFPPGEGSFLDKLKLRGSFGIGGGEFSQASTQESANKLSAGALGQPDSSDPETALTGLAGPVALDHGIARFAGLSFGVPGAAARMQGTYRLEDHKIDLHGQLRVDSKISDTTTGTKAFLLKVMDPFFKKRKKGEILPVRISGTYEKPLFGLDLMDNKARIATPSHTAPASAPARLHQDRPNQ